MTTHGILVCPTIRLLASPQFVSDCPVDVVPLPSVY